MFSTPVRRRRRTRPPTWCSARARTPSSSPRARPATTSTRCRWSDGAACCPRRSPTRAGLDSAAIAATQRRLRDSITGAPPATTSTSAGSTARQRRRPALHRPRGRGRAPRSRAPTSSSPPTPRPRPAARLAIELQGTLAARTTRRSRPSTTAPTSARPSTWDDIGAWEAGQDLPLRRHLRPDRGAGRRRRPRGPDALAFRISRDRQPLGLFLRQPRRRRRSSLHRSYRLIAASAEGGRRAPAARSRRLRAAPARPVSSRSPRSCSGSMLSTTPSTLVWSAISFSHLSTSSSRLFSAPATRSTQSRCGRKAMTSSLCSIGGRS